MDPITLATYVATVVASMVLGFVFLLLVNFAVPTVFATRPPGFSAGSKRMRNSLPRGVITDTAPAADRSRVLRHPRAEALATETTRLAGNADEDSKGDAAPLTLCSLFARASKLHGNRPFLGKRIGSGPYVWTTYDTALTKATEFGHALVALGLERGDRVAIYCQNRPEWMLGAAGANRVAMPTVPVYDTFDEAAALRAIRESRPRALLTSRKHLEASVRIATEVDCISVVVLLSDRLLDKDVSKAAPLEKLGGRARFLPFEEACALGRANPADIAPPGPDDVASIYLTSGSTGYPRGAVLTHRNVCSVIASASLSGIELLPTDVHISYIPLSHTFERLVCNAVVAAGGAIGFYRGDIGLLLDDVLELRPTVFPSVPRVFNRLHDRIMAAIASPRGGSALTSPLRFLARAAVSAKLRAIRSTDDATLCRSPILDHFLLSRIRARLGGRVRIILSGSAPIRPEVLNNLSVFFGATAVEGMGMTENGAGCCITWPGDLMGPDVGGPIAAAEVCVESIPDIDLSARGEPPRGELLVRGPQVFLGYDCGPGKTIDRSAFTADGWLRTGDICTINPNGTVSITERRSDVFKMSQGEFIAPQRIETVLVQCAAVSQIFCCADSMMPALIAIAVLDAETAPAWLAERGVDPWDRKAVSAAVLADFVRLSKEAGLNGLETVKAVHVEDAEAAFSPINGLATPSLKLRRRALRERYSGVMDSLYTALGFKKKA